MRLLSKQTSGISLFGVFVLLSAYIPTTAAPVSFQQAVADYNAGRYSLALSEFESYKAAYPNNAQVRYYLGLCHQSLNHISQARSEYQWVSERGSGSLKDMATAGLVRLGGARTSSSSSTTSSSSSSSGTRTSSRVATPSAGPSASPANADELERYMVTLINRDRAANGVTPPLRQSVLLGKVARKHAEDMVRRHYFDHYDPQGKHNGDRALAAGITSETHENLSQSYATTGKTYKDLVLVCEDQMITEPPNQHNHRENILGKFKCVGVGIAFDGDRVVLAQEFGVEDI